MSKCEKQGHVYVKFDERSIFCERCGHQKFLASAYQPSWTYWPPVYPTTVRFPWTTPWIVSSTGTRATDWDSVQINFALLGDTDPDDGVPVA